MSSYWKKLEADSVAVVPENTIEQLERRITSLRAEVRGAVSAGDRPQAGMLWAQLRAAEAAWDQAVEALSPLLPGRTAATSLVPLREQVHSTLTLLAVPATLKLIAQVYNACFAGELNSAKLTSLRRDEERSFRTAPGRPYYLCAGLAADRLTPVRALLAISTWPLERRIIGPLGSRVDFLTAAVNVAMHLDRRPWLDPAAARLLGLFAQGIPGATEAHGTASPDAVIRAARAELAHHEPVDRAHREAAADRARAQLDEPGQLFGQPKLT
ncbi:hypothetical protein ACFFX1_11000 [Dactylosporangium sucinum]